MGTNSMNTLDPQSPSRPSVPDSDGAIAGRPQRELNDEDTGDHPHPSRDRYDIV